MGWPFFTLHRTLYLYSSYISKGERPWSGVAFHSATVYGTRIYFFGGNPPYSTDPPLYMLDTGTYKKKRQIHLSFRNSCFHRNQSSRHSQFNRTSYRCFMERSPSYLRWSSPWWISRYARTTYIHSQFKRPQNMGNHSSHSSRSIWVFINALYMLIVYRHYAVIERDSMIVFGIKMYCSCV